MLIPVDVIAMLETERAKGVGDGIAFERVVNRLYDDGRADEAEAVQRWPGWQRSKLFTAIEDAAPAAFASEVEAEPVAAPSRRKRSPEPVAAVAAWGAGTASD